jgi:hypothetical protein
MGAGRVKSPCPPISGSFPVIPAEAGIQGFQTLVLGPRGKLTSLLRLARGPETNQRPIF